LDSVNYNRTHVKEVYESTYATKTKSITEIRDEHISTDIRFKNLIKRVGSPNLKNSSLIDIACGDGIKTNVLSQYFQNTLGVDFSSNAIKSCDSTFKSNVLGFKEVDIDKGELGKQFDFISSFGNSTFNVSNIAALASEITNIYGKFGNPKASMLIGTFTDFSGTAPSGWYNITKAELKSLENKLTHESDLQCTIYFPHNDINNYLSSNVKYTLKEAIRIFTQKRRYFYLVLTPKK